MREPTEDSTTTNAQHEHDTLCVHARIAERETAGAEELRELLAANFNEDEIEAYAADNEDVRMALDIMNISNDILAAATGYGQPAARNIRDIVSKNKTSLLEPTARQLVDLVEAHFDKPPTINMLQASVVSLAVGVALNTRIMDATNRAHLESSVINQFTAELVSRVSMDNICGSYLKHGTDKHDADNPFVKIAMEAADRFNQMCPQYEPIDFKFLLNKLNYLAMELNSAGNVHRFIDAIDDKHEAGFDTASLRTASDEMARQVGRLRSYEIKPMVFELGDIGADHRAVYREPRDFMADVGMTELADPKNALASVLLPMTTNANPVDLKLVQYHNLEGNKMSRVGLDGFEGAYVVTRDGELRSGFSLLNGTMSLRTMFERRGKGEQYELLRAKVMSQIFDATAPATLVEHIQNDDRVEQERQTDAAYKGDIVHDMVLRRIRYAKRPMRLIKKEFDEALRQEAAAAERMQRHLRHHDVTGHLRRIPASARPSDVAIANSKESFGPEYELPEGYTFVKKHERGDLAIGRVIGHHAVHTNVTVVG